MAYRARRSESEWRALIEDFEQSALSAKMFCEQENIAYASFLNWKRRLADGDAGTVSAPSFVDLSALTGADPMGRWRVELDLGNGMVLRLERC